ncbi:LOW QUALITY PROTEIN: carbohydrate sulfotransferase 13-like [Amphiura filiformis]|uniref:LOW QUALITY PROTEIN: carbohydrate sulfotransferase 13-like n=1 Tax=Amphiura filiformis TaxID=82378 RepID=UPI003B21033A
MGRRKQAILLLIAIVTIICCVIVEFSMVTPFFRSLLPPEFIGINDMLISHVVDEPLVQKDMSSTSAASVISDSPRSLSMAPASSNDQKRPAVAFLNDEDFMEKQKMIQEHRRTHLQQMCQTYQRETRDIKEMLSDYEKYHGTLLVDDKHKILHCNTPKVAGTSWKRVLNVLTGQTNSTSQGTGYENVNIARNIRRLASYTPSEIDHILKTYTKFMFARHPFSRLLSAFNNKLAPNSTDTRNRQIFRDAVGEVIQMAFHPCTNQRARRRKITCEYNITFHDFVRFLIDPRMEPFQNVHWKSNYELCKPCDIKYDIIGKYESLVEDANYVLKVTNVDHLVSFPSGEGNADTSTHSSNQQKLVAAYKQMSLHDIESLVRFFKMDFLLFDYPVATSEEFYRILNVKKHSDSDLNALKGIKIF